MELAKSAENSSLEAEIAAARARILASNEQIHRMRPRTAPAKLTLELPLLREEPCSGDDNAIAALGLQSDCGPSSFRTRASMLIPPLYASIEPHGLYTDLMLNVRSPFFGQHPDREYVVEVFLDGQPIDSRIFHSWYHQHQFFVPFHRLAGNEQTIVVSARSTSAVSDEAENPEFHLQAFACHRERITERIANGAIWLFSTARSGSTWLAADLICRNERARLMDEPGIGKMFAPMQWDAERFFELDAEWRCRYTESGLDYETCQTPRSRPDRFPTFERAFTDMQRENQIFRKHTFQYYHAALRQLTIGHVINEWGCRDFSRVLFKCPNESHAADFIMRAFPTSHMVFLMRDGRDVMRSRFSPFGSPVLAETEDKALRHYAIAFYSHLWNFQVDIIQSAFDAHSKDRRLFLKYEELRANTEDILTMMFDHLEMHATPEDVRETARAAALENVPKELRGPSMPRQNGTVGGFKENFTSEEVDLMETIMGPTLERYGYTK